MRKSLALYLVVTLAVLLTISGGMAVSQEAEDELNLAEANVMDVDYSQVGAEREYRFSVTLYHDDDGEDGYANWWQIETLDSEGIGRRKLLHAHGTKEFTRSSTIKIPEETRYLVVRGHDQTHGYGGRAAVLDLELEEIEFHDQGAEPDDFSDYYGSKAVDMKAYSNEEFGFTISFPKGWESNLMKKEKEEKPRVYREVTFRAKSSNEPKASVLVIANDLGQPITLDKFAEYMENRKEIFPQAGLEKIYRGELAGFPAVITEFTQASYKSPDEEGNGIERAWEKSPLKGKMVGLITEGYLYRVFVGVASEDFDEAKEKYIEPILGSFGVTPGD